MNLRTSLSDTIPHEEERLPTAALRKMEEHLAQQYATSSNLALQIVIKHARKILRDNPELKEFTMGMGTWFFVDNDGHYRDYSNVRLFHDLVAFDDFMCRWDETFKLTGQAVRFTADGPLVTDW